MTRLLSCICQTRPENRTHTTLHSQVRCSSQLQVFKPTHVGGSSSVLRPRPHTGLIALMSKEHIEALWSLGTRPPGPARPWAAAPLALPRSKGGAGSANVQLNLVPPLPVLAPLQILRWVLLLQACSFCNDVVSFTLSAVAACSWPSC